MGEIQITRAGTTVTVGQGYPEIQIGGLAGNPAVICPATHYPFAKQPVDKVTIGLVTPPGKPLQWRIGVATTQTTMDPVIVARTADGRQVAKLPQSVWIHSGTDAAGIKLYDLEPRDHVMVAAGAYTITIGNEAPLHVALPDPIAYARACTQASERRSQREIYRQILALPLVANALDIEPTPFEQQLMQPILTQPQFCLGFLRAASVSDHHPDIRGRLHLMVSNGDVQNQAINEWDLNPGNGQEGRIGLPRDICAQLDASTGTTDHRQYVVIAIFPNGHMTPAAYAAQALKELAGLPRLLHVHQPDNCVRCPLDLRNNFFSLVKSVLTRALAA